MKLTKYLHRVYLVSLNCLLTFAASVENSTVEPTTARAERSLRSGLAFVDANSIDRDDPAASLDGVYSECLLNLSFPCLQKKIIVFLDRLGRKKQVSLIGDFLTVVRTGPVSATVSEETTARRDESSLRSVIDGQVDRFFETHVLRVRVPSFLDDPGTENTVVDIDFGTGASTSEGRGKKGGKMKGMKKMMMMMGMMMCMKMAMMGPLMMGLIGLKAVKALILSAVSLTISKILLLKKLKGGGGGGGGGGGWKEAGGDSSGQGWDRSIESSYAHKTAFSAYAPIES
ncbi:unnamed protein product [Bemisia tabaci]|uniref:Uncharacterized protein n=1 Tax=Bemisia tabaci TaxID=7038 RepID=A0A9P0G244_BEMTA|nr:unnamed protein product [Bemisia tabaci]